MKRMLFLLGMYVGAVSADVVDKVVFEGLDRVDVEAVQDCLAVYPQKEFSDKDLDATLKNLFQKGFFSDIKFEKRGNVLVVKCSEKPMIDKVAFEGNHAISDDDMKSKITTRIGEGKLYDLYVVRDIISDMRAAYKSLGFMSVAISPKIIKHPGNKIDIVFEIDEKGQTTIKKIMFIGNKKFSDDDLKDVIMPKEERLWRFWGADSHIYNEDRVQVDIDQLTEYYKNNGYPFINITSLPAELSFDKKSVYCTYRIEEGAEYTISGFSLDSKIEKISPEPLRKFITFKKDKKKKTIFNAAEIRLNQNAVRKELALRNNPFTDVTLDIQFDKEKKTAFIKYTIVEAPKVFIEKIEIVGNTRTLDRVIRREFEVHEGDALNSYKVQRTIERLNGLDYFDSVQVNEEPGSAEDKKVLVVSVREKEGGTAALKFGLNVSDADGFGGFIGLTENNFMGTGRIFSVDAYWAQKLYGTTVGIFDPRFMDHIFGAGVRMGANRYDRKKTDDSVLRALNVEPYVRYRISEHLSHKIGYNISFNSRLWWNAKDGSLHDKVPDNIDETYVMKDEYGKYCRSEISSVLYYDHTDNPYNPTQGYDIQLTNSFAGVGGSVRYLRNELEGTYYRPVTKKLVFLTTAKVGYLHEMKNTRSSDRFTLGGESDLRGFDSFGVGPRDKITKSHDNGNSIGGNKFWAVSFMLKMPLSTREVGINGIAFVDFGSAWGSKYPKDKVQDSSAMRISTGIAIQWAKSPFGMPLSLIFAVPLKKKKFDEKQTFMLGQGA